MEKIIDLKDLLVHEILDLYSAEEQIIDGLPAMIDKADNPALKEALRSHLQVTKTQKDRLDKIRIIMTGETDREKSDNVFDRIFKANDNVKCRGTEGLIKEAEKMLSENMTPETRDAAIIGAAQKIEHYEIAGYGTARAYANELGLSYVADELEKTLNEEYEADDSLTKLALSDVNIKSQVAMA